MVPSVVTPLSAPLILKDPDNTYKQAYNNCNIAKDMIQTRLDKLMYQKKLYSELEHNNTNNNYDSIYKLRTMSNARGKLSYPYNQNNMMMEPIYYPLEMPLAGMPIELPRIEIGGSMRKKCRGGLDIESLMPLLAALKKRRPQPMYVPPPQPQIIYPEPEPVKNRGIKKIGGIKKFQDMNKDTFFDISDIFKGINFVTTRHGYIRRIEKTILKHNDTPTSVSNNRRKALLRAKILINFDFDNDLLSEFEINKDCIIVNLSNNKISLRKNFRGCIIDGVKICFKNRYEKHINSDKYNIEELYKSYIQNLDYCKAVEHNNLNDCKIINLVGNRGIILNDEIVNNFTNSTIRLDKKRKKD